MKRERREGNNRRNGIFALIIIISGENHQRSIELDPNQ